MSTLKHLLATSAVTGFVLGYTNVYASADVDPHDAKYHNNSPISITGTVTKSLPDAFELSYGEGSIVVEMDDWDWYDESSVIHAGEKVTVFGDIDHDLYETRKIEADVVYAYNRSTFYYADDVDEEDFYARYSYYPTNVDVDTAPDGSFLGLRGVVTAIDGQEFRLNTGDASINVDTETLGYNPLDDEGYQKVTVGDYVYVSGTMDVNFFEKREIDATQLLTLYKDRTSS